MFQSAELVEGRSAGPTSNLRGVQISRKIAPPPRVYGLLAFIILKTSQLSHIHYGRTSCDCQPTAAFHAACHAARLPRCSLRFTQTQLVSHSAMQSIVSFHITTRQISSCCQDVSAITGQPQAIHRPSAFYFSITTSHLTALRSCVSLANLIAGQWGEIECGTPRQNILHRCP